MSSQLFVAETENKKLKTQKNLLKLVALNINVFSTFHFLQCVFCDVITVKYCVCVCVCVCERERDEREMKGEREIARAS